MDAAALLAILDDYGFEDIADARKANLLDLALREIALGEPWTWLETEFLLDTDGTAVPSDYPADVQAIKTLQWLSPRGRLSHIRLDHFRRTLSDPAATDAYPTRFYFVGEEMRIWPVPAAGTDVLLLDYIKHPGTITATTTEANIDLPIRYHDLLWLGALVKLYPMDDDLEMAAWARTEYDGLLGRLRNPMWLREFSDPDPIWIVDSDFDEEEGY